MRCIANDCHCSRFFPSLEFSKKGATTTYGANGETLTVKDGANNLTTFSYDGFDRLTEVEFPLPTTGSNASNPNDYESYAYDANGNLTSKRLRSGQSVTLTYDALNRLTQETFPSGTSQPVYYAYDLLNRTLMVSNVGATGPGVAYAYDALNRVTSMTQNSRTLAYAYDAAGNRTAITWPDASNPLTANYVYDPLNNVTQIEQNGATSGTGLLASYSYDALGRRTGIGRAGGAGMSTSYGYDGVSRLSTLAQSLAGSAGTSFTFGYNPANQVISRADSNGAFTVAPSAISLTYTANGLNQYSTITGGTQTLSAGPQAILTYDPLGRIQSETSSGNTSNFLYDGAFLAEEYTASGTTTARYVPGPGADEPLAVYSGADLSNPGWYAADQEGSIIATANASGAETASYAYGPYGEPLTSGGATAWGGSRYRYTGQIEIPGALAYFYKARMYDPATGRFFQTDPAGFGGGINIYAYAMNDPVNGWDPMGLDYTNIGNIQCITSVQDITLDPSGYGFTGYAASTSCTSTGQTFSGQNPGAQFAGPGASKPQNTQPKISCSTRLPNGQTVGQVVQKSIENIGNAAGPYDVGGLGEFGAFFATVQSGGPIDFKNTLRGSASPAFLGAAGNFAYGAIASGIGYSQGVAEFGAGGYALSKSFGNPNSPYGFNTNNPFGEDNSAAQNLPAGYASAGCTR